MLYLFWCCINTTFQKSPVDLQDLLVHHGGYHRYTVADGGAQLLVYNWWIISYPCLTRQTRNLALCYQVLVTFTTIVKILFVFLLVCFLFQRYLRIVISLASRKSKGNTNKHCNASWQVSLSLAKLVPHSLQSILNIVHAFCTHQAALGYNKSAQVAALALYFFTVQLSTGIVCVLHPLATETM